MARKFQEFRETVREISAIVKTCLTSFWFWLPSLFAIYMYLQLWMVFYINPLSLVILPAILMIYMLLEENKRFKAQYGLDVARKMSASDPMGSRPHDISGSNWNVEKLVEEHKRLLGKKTQSENELEKDTQ